MKPGPQWRFWIDTGGTFTDCLAQAPDGTERRIKVLSTGAVRGRVEQVATYPGGEIRVRVAGLPDVDDGFFAGFEVSRARGEPMGRVRSWVRASCVLEIDPPASGTRGEWSEGEVIDLDAGEEAPLLAMRLLTGTGGGRPLPPAELCLATTRGTNALLEGKGANVAFFVTEGFGDLLRIGDQRRPDLFALHVVKPAPLHGPVVEVPERLAADGSVVRPLDLEAIRGASEAARRAGAEVAAVALLHSYRNPAHERALAAFLRELGYASVSLSSELAPFIRIVPRAETTVVDAVLAPVMNRYLDGVSRGVAAERFHVMTSSGGLVRRASYRPKDSLLSGPAGGVSGAAAVARRAGIERVITFDMGGTSTDVARVDGDFEYRFQHTVGPARVMAPALRVESIAAGGGSICRFDGSALVVGPESAGAAPGPACYGVGGPLTLTDVNLLLGRLDPGRFGVPVFVEAAEVRLAEVIATIAAATGARPDRGAVLKGFLDIADERMAEAIRRISVREGYDPAGYTLVSFGGAGGLHACAVAGKLGMRRVLVPADSGLLSAFGLREAVAERFAERQVLRRLEDVVGDLPAIVEALTDDAKRALVEDGVEVASAEARRRDVELRFAGQESGLVVEALPVADLIGRFERAYEQRYGYVPRERPVEVVAVRVVVSEERRASAPEVFPGAKPGNASDVVAGDERGQGALPMDRSALGAGARLPSRALVQDRFSTLFVAAEWRGRVGSRGSILLEHDGNGVEDRGAAGVVRPEVVDLELFTSRFQAVVEEMGQLLQRCALSVNVKERLDFSCALLDASGELVANAPHIPVHLGALGACVRRVREVLALGPGDVAVTNHPAFGGSHLPDVTLIAPVHDGDGELLGYVANRAHHAEIGGVRPGSMPPDARCLAEEGVVLPPSYLARGRSCRWNEIERRLSSGPCPSRAVAENIADLHAQLASIRLGARAMTAMAQTFGARAVRRFMGLLKERAAEALAAALRARWPIEARLEARDELDDGLPIQVVIEAEDAGRWRLDFGGSADVHPGNLNATPAIVRSAVIYVLRLLAGRDLPLNEGLMRDVDLVIPEGLLSPPFPDDPVDCPAVVGGNVETSQRVVDVVLRAFGLAACSQGTMNNTIFGTDRWGYYETVGGGAGAGPGFDGADAVHCHMTNTAMTDAEVLEVRLPVRVERFAIRRGSGGGGRHHGGDGIERRLRFLEPVALSVLTQRRTTPPPGLGGGQSGACGCQWIERADGAIEPLSSVGGASLAAGDGLAMLTPGGGGWGA